MDAPTTRPHRHLDVGQLLEARAPAIGEIDRSVAAYRQEVHVGSTSMTEVGSYVECLWTEQDYCSRAHLRR